MSDQAKIQNAGLRLLQQLIHTPEKITDKADILRNWRYEVINQAVISVSNSSCAKVSGSEEIIEGVKAFLSEHAVKATIKETGCYGNCAIQPVVDIQMPGKSRLSFSRVKRENLENILESVLAGNIHQAGILGQHPIKGSENWEETGFFEEQAWIRGQKRILMEHAGIIDPGDIREYYALDGYAAFLKLIRECTNEEVCELIAESGLKGRSGSGFPTAAKWKSALHSASDRKYIICNADESDPSAFVTRHLIESNPHQVIEGTAIAAYATGADRAIIYLGEGCRQCESILQKAIDDAAVAGMIGKDINGSGFSLKISIFSSPGAFICGEETALIASMEGRRGIPRYKPPYPATSGYRGKPTVVNNIETLCNLPHILSKGISWFRNTGTEESPGTKLLSVSGMVRWPGVYEMEMGTPLRELIFKSAGGMKEDSDFKALLIGGAMGHLADEQTLGNPISFEGMNQPNLSMGSGGLVVMDRSVCIMDLALYGTDFLAEESCGKCITCREGLRSMQCILELLIRRPANESTHQTLERFKGAMQLKEIGDLSRRTSLCGLGRNAGNIIGDILLRFRAEFEAHVFDRYCDAGVCRKLRTYAIDPEKCTGCTLCAKKCPENAISGSPKHTHVINEEKCRGCGICFDVCKFSAVSMK